MFTILLPNLSFCYHFFPAEHHSFLSKSQCTACCQIWYWICSVSSAFLINLITSFFCSWLLEQRMSSFFLAPYYLGFSAEFFCSIAKCLITLGLVLNTLLLTIHYQFRFHIIYMSSIQLISKVNRQSYKDSYIHIYVYTYMYMCFCMFVCLFWFGLIWSPK